MLELTMLPARQGDALWIRWGNFDSPHQMIIDMGTEGIGDKIRERLEAIDETRREFELLVVTHVDSDHIGGVLTCLAEVEQLPGLKFKDVWFNGWVHLDGGQFNQPGSAGASRSDSGLESFGPAQGERLSSWLRKQAWNKAFDGKPIVREPGKKPSTITLAGGLTLTVLSPTPDRLSEFIPKWKDDVEIALNKGTLHEVSQGLESYGSKLPPDLVFPEDLEALAASNSYRDSSEANGSSISLLLEYKDQRIVLAGDAFADDIVAGLAELSSQQQLKVDAFKLPHHGSKNNVTKSLVEAVSCRRWLFSTDGTRFRHPDAVAIARVICYSSQQPAKLFFNVPSQYNRWWSSMDWKRMYKYDTEYGNDSDGITIKLPIDDD